MIRTCTCHYSGSMEPAFHRGDLLFLTNRVEDPIRVGEIVVFRIEGREIPIVHRVLKIHEKYDRKHIFKMSTYAYLLTRSVKLSLRVIDCSFNVMCSMCNYQRVYQLILCLQGKWGY